MQGISGAIWRSSRELFAANPMNLLANGKTFAICREHRVAFSGKSCPKCVAELESMKRRRIRFENQLKRAIQEQGVQRAI